jgi:CheY-like chemotaxis protein
MSSIASSHRSKAQILIVEDEGLIAADIQATLQDLDYEVSGIAASAEEAHLLASVFASDVILMDIKIRGPVDGIVLAKDLRERYGTPVVFLTSNADPQTFERAAATSPFGFITKPFTPFHLNAALQLALSRREAERAIHKKELNLEAVLGGITDPILATDIDGRITFLNVTGEIITGWNAREALGKPIDDVLLLEHGLASEIVSEVYSEGAVFMPVEVTSTSHAHEHRWLSGSVLKQGTSKCGVVLMFKRTMEAQTHDLEGIHALNAEGSSTTGH